MKQLELNITINETKDYWEIYARPKNDTSNKLVSWFKGDTREEVLERFCQGITESYARYWFITENK